MSDMLLKAVFWDLDGTLIDSEPYWHEGEMEIAAAHGGYWDEDLAWSCSGTPLDHCAKTMIEHGTNLPPEQIAKAMVDYVAKKEFERVPWTNGVLDVLGSLVDAGIPSVLVTTSPRRLAQNVIDHAPAGAFAGFVCGDDDLPHKPDPAPYLAAAKDARHRNGRGRSRWRRGTPWHREVRRFGGLGHGHRLGCRVRSHDHCPARLQPQRQSRRSAMRLHRRLRRHHRRSAECLHPPAPRLLNHQRSLNLPPAGGAVD